IRRSWAVSWRAWARAFSTPPPRPEFAVSRSKRKEREPEMEIKADEITAILKQQLAGYEKAIDVAEVGTVLSVGDGIARVYGLDKVMAGELVDFGHDLFGLALNLEQDQVGVVLLGESQHVKEGQEVRRTRRIIQ